VSQYLKVLQAASLVISWLQGNRSIYLVNQARLDDLREYLESFWTPMAPKSRVIGE